MRTTMWVACSGLLLGTAVAQADEEKISIDKTPKAVLDAVAERFPEAKVVAVEKEVEDGKVVYEVEIIQTTKPKKEGRKPRDQKIELTLTEDGSVVKIEKPIAPKRLPAPVTDALNAKYPGSTIKKAESIAKMKQGKARFNSFEVLLETQAKTFVEVCLSKDGKITKEEPKDKEEGKE